MAQTHGTEEAVRLATNENDNHVPPGTPQGGRFAAKVESIEEVLDHARRDRQRDVFHDYQRLGAEEAKAIFDRSGMDVAGYKRLVSSSSVNHILNKHADDQHPITEDDFRQLLPRLSKPVNQMTNKQPGKPDRLVSEVRDESGRITIVEEQRTGRGKLALVSMYRP